MTKYGSNLKKGTWLMAAVLATFITACSQDSIFGGSQGTGTGGVPGPAGTGPNLGAAAAFGGFGGGAGMTNQGTSTVITGAQGQPVSIGTTGASTTMTGFHSNSVPYAPPSGCIYTEVLGTNIGAVSGAINTDAPPPTVTCPNEGTAATKAIADAAAAAARAAFIDLSPAARPGATLIAAQLGGQTLPPGLYSTASGAFLLTGASDLTLDAGGNPDAVWIFQMGTTLTVGAAGAPRSVILAGGAQPKNVFWQVGSSATINPSAGGTMVGTIISEAGTSFSTPGQPCCVTLNGRALALTASVTMVNTVINVPAP